MAPDGEDYVNDGWLQWRSLVYDSAAAIVLSWIFLAADWVGFVLGAVETAISNAGSWLESLIYETVTLPSEGMIEAWQTAAEFIGNFGIAGYVLAVVLAVVTIQLAVSTLSSYAGWG